MVRSSRAYIIPASTLMGTRTICSYFASGAPRSRGATVAAATRPLIPARADIPGGEYNITARQCVARQCLGGDEGEKSRKILRGGDRKSGANPFKNKIFFF